jgi:hypothetical protein
MWRRNKTVAVAGAVLGFALFLGVGLLPSLMYGGYAGLMLAGGIFGTPVPATLFARGLVAFGMLLGVFATAAVFAVGGAAAGSVIATLVAAATREEAEKAATSARNR